MLDQMGALGHRQKIRWEFSRRMKTTAGSCSTNGSGLVLRFNELLWGVLPADRRIEILAHETAHAVSFFDYEDFTHGSYWKELMEAVGFPLAEARHEFSLEIRGACTCQLWVLPLVEIRQELICPRCKNSVYLEVST